MSASRLPLRQRPAFWAYLFLLPWMVGFVLFRAGPMVASAILSLFRNDMVRAEFRGLGHYVYIFTDDPHFWRSVLNTALYVGLSVPIGLTGSLLIAVLLNRRMKAMGLWRTLYYVPSLVPAVASAYIWRLVLDPDNGIFNQAILAVTRLFSPELIMADMPQWLFSSKTALLSLVVMSLWGIGGGRMIIFLAGLQSISSHYYEVAEIDGAGPWRQFVHITLPLLSPVIFFNLVLGIVGASQVFASAYLLTRGGPNEATLFYVLNIFFHAFEQFHMGYASALAWILFVGLLFATVIQFNRARRWVHYEGE